MHGTTPNTKSLNNEMPTTHANLPNVTAIAIGRNEGDRLIRCLNSLLPQVSRVIYVDSGSTDGSADMARKLGAEVIALDMAQPFTAARARNAGLERVTTGDFVQLVDGDCEVDPQWIETAIGAMSADRGLAVVAGRRRERFPDKTIYNRLCDTEWNTPVGPAQAVGGDMLARREAIAQIGGFDPGLIAGEEPEMCLRLARAGWKIQRLDAEMTLHDAAMTRFAQWWKRSRRAGHAFAEVSWRYRNGDERFWRRETARSVFWAGILPFALIVAALIQPWFVLGLLIYSAQITRMAMRDPDPDGRWQRAAFTMLGKFPEFSGVTEFHIRRLLGRKSGLIEYK